jgi:putative ABC transport system permease protein
MFHIALKMLVADRAKFAGLLFGIVFTSFLVTFAASYFCGFMTAGFALVSENADADVWVMDPAVESVEQTINMPASALLRVRSVDGVADAVPLMLASTTARLPNGRFQQFQAIGVDDATLAGAPLVAGRSADGLHAADTVVVDAGGTSGKLETPSREADRWPADGPHLDAPTREMAAGDELLLNDHLLRVVGHSRTLPRFPVRPLLYATRSTLLRVLPPERNWLTFVLVKARSGVSPGALAMRITRDTGLRARSAADFKADTVRWFLVNSEDVGDIAAMLTLAMAVGFGVTGVMLYMFTYEHQKQYAVLKAMGARAGTVLSMVSVQAATCALIGTGIGIGLCGLVGDIVMRMGYPFRMMWFTPIAGLLGVVVVSLVAGAISVRPIIRLQPAVVFASR